IEDVRAGGVTVLLVTHFMEEAQRLCDRIAVIDKGRIAALDTPAGLIRRSAGATVISFTPSAPLDDRELNTLPGLASLAHHDGRVTLSGTDETVSAVLTLLARLHITAHQLRVTEATLDDAFLDLTKEAAA
ncbi:MAG: ABC transporter ATP-binding protein, partial [Streptomyces sp.]|nr:ABC transporter ATP-binding protein [Streptomyces sp.]